MPLPLAPSLAGRGSLCSCPPRPEANLGIKGVRHEESARGALQWRVHRRLRHQPLPLR